MPLTIEKVKNFYDNHPNNTTPNFLKNHQAPVLRILALCLDETGDVLECLKDPEGVVQTIMNKYSNPNTIKYYLQSLLFLVDEYPGLAKRVPRDKYYDYWLGSKVYKKEEDETTLKPPNIEYQDIQEKVNETFGENSIESLFIDFYEEAPLRLDFHDIRINDENASNNLDLETRILKMDEYNKTQKKYGTKKIKLSKSLVEKIKNIRGTSGKVFPFSKTTQGAKIKKMLEEAGFKGATMNTLRHSVQSKDMSPLERVEIARRAGNAPTTSVDYKRPKTSGGE